MSDPLINYKKPEYPKREFGEAAVITRIEYIGDTETLEASLPVSGQEYGGYLGQVKSATIEPTEDVGISVAMITMEQPIDNTETQPGELTAISYEIRWIDVERSMYEHPDFNEGGEFFLTKGDIYDIEKWRAPENTKDLRDNFKYDEQGYETTLSANAKMFAQGILLGLETYDDKAPVAIKISEYVGGPPPTTDAGLKEDPVGFPNLPEGFEWRKEAADSTRAAGATRWNLTEEWQGAKKVLFDRLKIYWLPPT